MSNQLAVIEQEVVRPALPSLMPRDISDAMKLSEIMSNGNLVPKHLQGNTANCFMIIEQAMRWGMSPMAVAQGTSVINGRLMFEGKLVAAVVNANGNLSQRLRYEYSGKGDDLVCMVIGTIKGELEPRTVKVRLGDVKTQNEQWRKQPEQQLTYHASRVWARRHMPELMMGVYAPEEFDEAPRPVKPAEPIKVIDTQPIKTAPAAKDHDWIQWAKEFKAKIEATSSIDDLRELEMENQRDLQNMSVDAPKYYERMREIIRAHGQALLQTTPSDTGDYEPGAFDDEHNQAL